MVSELIKLHLRQSSYISVTIVSGAERRLNILVQGLRVFILEKTVWEQRPLYLGPVRDCYWVTLQDAVRLRPTRYKDGRLGFDVSGTGP